MLNDIVYIIKNGTSTDEIKYSIRSVVENFPYNSIWIYGGKPKGIRPDHYVEYVQHGETRYAKVTNTIREICKNEEITPDFWLFNDDFFILQKVDDFPTLHQGTLYERVEKIRARRGAYSGYSLKLKATADVLRRNGYEQIDYALHCPILINRAKALETIKKFSDYPMFRSLYGNHHSIGGVRVDDYKIQNTDGVPTEGALFVSTSDRAYRVGKAGEYVRRKFSKPSKYEV